ncbi:MAG: tRNA uridine-5-carboxymethylaminomethyl(34) synthesis GTPase MnmE [Endomicrobiales bacterium]|nr:tRNA uridine-5-carboxymethylaminomethyl(34) synthesis GTPase MnmE [Endomicrobiales bacterium]
MPFREEDTIAAISTPLGKGGLGVIRLSGPASLSICRKFFSPASKKSALSGKTHVICHGFIKDSGKTVDEVLVSPMLSPGSYTGEDVVEISAHGGPVILKKILDLCLKNGARAAGPGEFTYRAFLNGKLDLVKAEAVCDLIASATELAAENAFLQLSGSLSGKLAQFKKSLLDIASSLEVSLDYGDEDIKFVTNRELQKSLRDISSDIEGLLSTFEKSKYLKQGVRIAITGKPNSGKSSLLNALLERERSIVTDIPGTTRDTIEECVDLKGLPAVLIDTAGVRGGPLGRVERIGRERALKSITSSDIVLWLIDSSRKLDKNDAAIAATLKPLAGKKSIFLLFNKSDLPAVTGPKDIPRMFPFKTLSFKISALKREGLNELEDAVAGSLCLPGPVSNALFITNSRHFETLRKIKNCLLEAVNESERKSPEEITAFHVREALGYLGELTGETAAEDVLKNIFSRFCVGK